MSEASQAQSADVADTPIPEVSAVVETSVSTETEAQVETATAASESEAQAAQPDPGATVGAAQPDPAQEPSEGFEEAFYEPVLGYHELPNPHALMPSPAGPSSAHHRLGHDRDGTA